MALADTIKGLVGPGSMFRQFFVWNIMSDIVSTALGPFIQSLSNQVNAAHPMVPSSPPILADMVVRGIVESPWAQSEAAKSGVSKEDFALLVRNTGEPPSLIELLLLFRRGKIDQPTLVRAIKQSRVKDEWIDTILMLGIQPPSPTDILRAYLQGQVDGDRARELYRQLGGDPDFFQLMYDTEGSAPTPNEAAEMARKGIIPWTGSGPGVVSYEQAFLEGPWRNKWAEAFRKAAEYLPPPRTITAMLREGSLTVQEATDLLRRQGVPPELVGSYLSDASSTKTSKTKELTESTISTLYQEGAISDTDALAYLQLLKYTADEAQFVVTAWQMARELHYRNTAITTVHTQFINHKISEQDTMLALDALGVPPNQRDHLLQLWSLEAATKVALLTTAEIKAGWKKNLLTDDEVVERLAQHGYNDQDIQVLMGSWA